MQPPNPITTTAPGSVNTGLENHVLSPTEQLLTKYKCTKLLFPKCDGQLLVTNERLIFFGRGINSRIVNEVQIQTVTGLKSYFGRKFIPRYLIIGIVLCLVGLLLTVSSAMSMSARPSFYGGPSAGTIVLGIFGIFAGIGVVAGGILFFCFLCYPLVFHLDIFAQAIAPAIQIGEPQVSGGALYSVIGRPTEDTDRMMRELGAWIKAVQKGEVGQKNG